MQQSICQSLISILANSISPYRQIHSVCIFSYYWPKSESPKKQQKIMIHMVCTLMHSQVPYRQFLVKWGRSGQSTKFFLVHPVVLSFDFRVGAVRGCEWNTHF